MQFQATFSHTSVIAHDLAELRRGLGTLLPELRGRALRLTKSPAQADDLVQDTVERALKFQAQYQRGTNLRGWVYQILFSVFVSRYRRLRRERNALKDLASDPCAWTCPEPFAAPDTRGGLTSATERSMGALPSGFRVVVEMVDLEERTYREAAEALGLPLGTVMSRLHRGRRLLAESLAGEALNVREARACQAA